MSRETLQKILQLSLVIYAECFVSQRCRNRRQRASVQICNVYCLFVSADRSPNPIAAGLRISQVVEDLTNSEKVKRSTAVKAIGSRVNIGQERRLKFYSSSITSSIAHTAGHQYCCLFVRISTSPIDCVFSRTTDNKNLSCHSNIFCYIRVLSINHQSKPVTPRRRWGCPDRCFRS